MKDLVVISTEELESLIESSVRKVLSQFMSLKPKADRIDYLSIDQVCDFLKLARQTVYGMTSKRQIPFIKKGKKLLFVKKDLELWLEEGKHLSINNIQQNLKKVI